MIASVRRRSLVLIPVLAVLVSAPARPVAAQDGKPEIDFWPVFYYDKTLDGKSSVTEVLWPFIEGKEDPEWKESYFRPFWNEREEKGKEFKDQEILWPLGRVTQRGDTTHTRFFPFKFKTEEKKKGEDKDETETDDIFLPMVFKKRKKGDNYTAIFPFYGHITDRFGRDEIKFVMWPIYTWQRKGDVSATNVLWPIFSISSYPGGGGLKVWPFFGVSEKKGTFKKSFLLWPLYSYQWAKLKSGGTYECAVMPLIAARERSPAGEADAVIWPFFQHIVKKKEGTTEDWFPWPFFGRARGKDYRKDQFLPFFSSTKHGGSKDDIILWPISFFSERDTGDTHYKSARVLPFWYDVKEEWRTDNTNETYFQLWPFFHTSKKRDGVEKTESLSPVWFKENDGWERNWAPFFWVFQTGKDKGATKYDHVLHRLYRNESGKDYKLFEVKHLFRFWKRGEQWEIAVLSGLRIGGRKSGDK